MIHVYVTAAFSKNGAGGNKAGVVLNRPELTAREKMAISRRLGYSETAFITPSDRADFHLEYFTPTEEVPLCGHATIASFSTLHRLGLLPRSDLTMETAAGLLQLQVSPEGMVMMQQNPPQYYETLSPADLAPVMGCREEDLGGPIQIISTGLKDIILPLASEAALASLKPDFGRMTELSRRMGVVGVHAFAEAENGRQADAVCRNFAPLYGIDEESATGTASCALAAYLARYREQKEDYLFDQGESMGLPSRIIVRADYSCGAMTDVRVGGMGYLTEELELDL